MLMNVLDRLNPSVFRTTGSLDEAASVAFILKFASALHQYGTSAHRLEEAMSRISRKLGIEGHFFSAPTSLFVSFGPPESQRTSFVRVEPGEVNLEKLVLLDDLAGEVIRGDVSPARGVGRVDEIMAAGSRYGALVTVIAFGTTSAAASRFLGGGWNEILVATLIGTLIGILAIVLGPHPTLARVFESIAAILAAAVAVLAAHFLAPFSVFVATLAGLIVLIPGLTLTIAMTELAMRNLVSGTVRLMSAVLIFFEIGFGVAIGNQIGKFAPPLASASPAPALPAWTVWVALVIAAVGFMILLKARPQDIGWILLTSLLAFIGARTGAVVLGPDIGGGFGALLVGIGGNVYNRLCQRPAAVMIVPGILLLVPGSVGLGGLFKILEKDTITGLDATFKMVLIAVSLVTGLLLANLVVPPRKAL